MPIAVTAHVGAGNTANQSTAYATASFTAVANSFLYVFVAGSPNVTYTVTGQGLTWTMVGHYNFSGTTRVMEVHRAPVSASPVAGALSITPSASATGCAWSAMSITGLDTATPNGTPVTATGTGVSTLSATLPAGDPDDRSLRGFYSTNNTANTITPPTGWTELHEASYGTPGTKIETAWHPTAYQTSCPGTEDSTYDLGLIAVRLIAAGDGAAAINAQYRPPNRAAVMRAATR